MFSSDQWKRSYCVISRKRAELGHMFRLLYCLLTIHKTYNIIYKGEEELIKTIDTPPTIKMHNLKASLKMIN